MGWWSRLGARLKPATIPDPVIAVTPEGFDILSPDQGVLESVRWSDVVRIQTYKIDLVTTDCIWLLFERRDKAEPVQASEEWKGFSDLFAPLRAAFPAIPEDWYEVVMKPPFELNQRVLYDANT